MKQIPMTPQLAELIKKSVGEDVDVGKLAVFETIALNTRPLPGKAGTLFERAVTSPVTLAQMVDYINAGNSLPLMSDHELFGEPKGRMFHAGLNYTDEADIELRALFYLDETEETLIKKLDAGSLDEVSVSFLASAMLCSECGWDYFQFGKSENFQNRTCANGHEIGENGVHAELVGLNQFIELSLVARGAADNPKIVGKSQAKLAPQTTYRLAATGFDTDALVVRASIGVEEDMDTTKLLTDLSESKAEVITLTRDGAAKDTQITSLTAERDAAKTRVSELETEVTQLKAESKVPDDYEPSKAEAAEGVAYLQEQLNHLRVAKGEAKLEGDKLPTKVADLKAQISELTDNLTSVLPVGGRAVAAGTEDDENKAASLKRTKTAFSLRNK